MAAQINDSKTIQNLTILKSHPKISQKQSTLTPHLESDEIQNSLAQLASKTLDQNSISVNGKKSYLKLACIVLLSSMFILYRFGNFVKINTNCIMDTYQEYTLSLNRKLYEGWSDVILGIGQVIMDFWVFFSVIFWMIVIKNMRFPIAVFTFYMVRSVIMLFIKFPFPENIVWIDPGFFSFTVPYEQTRDFFFSGHTGALVLIMLQFSQLTVLHSNKPAGYVWVLVFICLVYIMNMLIITRGHYTIDVVGGLIFSAYCYGLINKITESIDRVISAPYKYVIEPLIRKANEWRIKRNVFNEENQGTTN